MPTILANAYGCILKLGAALGQRLGHKKAKNHQTAEKAQHFIRILGMIPRFLALFFHLSARWSPAHWCCRNLTNHILLSFLLFFLNQVNVGRLRDLIK